MGHVGSSKDASKGGISTAAMEMDDEDDEDLGDVELDPSNSEILEELGEDFVKHVCKKASMLFFEEYGLISHQINSFNHFVQSGLQNSFDSFGDLLVTPGFDPSKKGENEHFRYASVNFGNVSLDKPMFWGGDSNAQEFKMLPRHARIQRMTYASKIKIHIKVQVYVPKKVRSDKFKTGKEEFLDREIMKEDEREIIIGRLPVMVKSDLCWMKDAQKYDCEFDHGGYFIIKGAEKTFIAQEQLYLKRLWVINTPGWMIAYKSQMKRNRMVIKLVGNPRIQELENGDMFLTVYFLSVEVPVWILFFALGASSDKEVVDLICCSHDDVRIQNILFASVRDADEKCPAFRRGRISLQYLEKCVKSVQFPPSESIQECLEMYVFPGISGLKRKARFLAYMVKGLLLAYTGRRKCDSRDDFRNKRLELANELLDRELRVHIAHARKRMAKALQRDLYGDRDVRPIEHYLDASIITNGLQRAFSTGAWAHPYKRMERISGVVANVGRTNPLQTMAELRRARQQVQYTGKVGDARYPHPSHWGKVCFLSTPDGENCGLVKNLAVTGLVSTNASDISEYILPKLLDCGMEELVDDTSTHLVNKDKVLLNGDWVGVCPDSSSFVAELRSRRRRNELPHQVEIKRDQSQHEVRIYSDAGRILRPLLVVSNLLKIKGFKSDRYSFQSLLDKGVIELIGPEEEEDCCTAWGIEYLFGKEGKRSVKYTHCELDMSFLLGLGCSLIPFANHDHARRVLYQSQKHSSQAIGFSTTNPNIRVDTLSHQLHYPQKPLFRLGYNSLGAFATINHLHFQAYYLAMPFPIEKAPTKKIANIKGGVKISELLKYPVRGLVFEGGDMLEDVSNVVSDACICLQNNNTPFNVLISDCGKQVYLLPQCYAEKQALGEVDPELLDTQVNPAVWEISGHMVLKRKKDYDEASEGNAWRLLAEVSLPEERFQEVNDLIFEAIGCGELDVSVQSVKEVDAVSTSEHPSVVVAGSQECVVLQ